MNFRVPCCIITQQCRCVGMVDEADSKSVGVTLVWVRVPPPAPSHPNTLDQRAKSPVISRCSGFFMTENFQSIPWLNGNATVVRTGFEPLFFHIQAEFQWQRPFSEGCRGEIPEKTKKNLSQSYGRWIVGFHEPMTSAFFALKKGAADWRYDIERRTHTAEGKISA